MISPLSGLRLRPVLEVTAGAGVLELWAYILSGLSRARALCQSLLSHVSSSDIRIAE
jgi:hypothetical protein